MLRDVITGDALWSAAHTERAALAEDLAGLADARWAHLSCSCTPTPLASALPSGQGQVLAARPAEVPDFRSDCLPWAGASRADMEYTAAQPRGNHVQAASSEIASVER